jgi:hypothetical protein
MRASGFDPVRIGLQLRALRAWLDLPDDDTPCPPGVRAWLRLAVQAYVAEGIPIDRGLGLDVPPGGAYLRPAAALALAERNLQLVVALRLLSGGWRAKARKIAAAAAGLRDGSAAWTEGLALEEVGILMDLVQRHPDLPTSASRLQEIERLSGQIPDYVGHPAVGGKLPPKSSREARYAAKKRHRAAL